MQPSAEASIPCSSSCLRTFSPGRPELRTRDENSQPRMFFPTAGEVLCLKILKRLQEKIPKLWERKGNVFWRSDSLIEEPQKCLYAKNGCLPMLSVTRLLRWHRFNAVDGVKMNRGCFSFSFFVLFLISCLCIWMCRRTRREPTWLTETRLTLGPSSTTCGTANWFTTKSWLKKVSDTLWRYSHVLNEWFFYMLFVWVEIRWLFCLIAAS